MSTSVYFNPMAMYPQVNPYAMSMYGAMPFNPIMMMMQWGMNMGTMMNQMGGYNAQYNQGNRGMYDLSPQGCFRMGQMGVSRNTCPVIPLTALFFIFCPTHYRIPDNQLFLFLFIIGGLQNGNEFN